MNKFIIFFSFTLLAFAPLSFGAKYLNSEEGLNVTGTLSIYPVYRNLTDDEEGKIRVVGVSANINYAFLVMNQFKIQPYLSLNPASPFTGMFFTGVLAEYLFKNKKEKLEISPSLGVDMRALTTYKEVSGWLIGIPFTVKYFLSPKTAISGLAEPAILASKDFQDRAFGFRLQVGYHHFFGM